ncbi:hypothetical protein BS47DRAFT_1391634 [Hydnum rufescens UP504]|uniref:Uncharacterized protein n=1 Tax=Hydnum rufescens UP504 TaxID=1448309 RepID=A0A9P6B0V5_9AGAM|nr:hypothetical protein BS47DRAFT_1391634 [Hydnum rufescens UP504]
MLLTTSLLYLSSLPTLFYTIDARTTYTFGQNCSQAAIKLAHGTYQLSSNCGPTMFCASNNTCAHKGCRRDEYPLGYKLDHFPPKCSSSTFCPDEEDACLSLLPVGSPCQLNRDDECEPPPDASQLGGPRNYNGSVCLNFQCMWANATLGSTCIVENVPYIVYDQATGSQYINIVSRDNCKNGMYCDSTQKLCVNELALGRVVLLTRSEWCTSDNCALSGQCGPSASASKHVSTWVYAVVCAGIVGSMLAILITLFMIHRRSRETEQEKRAQYWREQEAMRNNILSMREQARASLLSLPSQSGNVRGGYRDQDYPPLETSQTGMLYAAAKASGLRNKYTDDTDADSMEEALVHPSSQDEDDYQQRIAPYRLRLSLAILRSPLSDGLKALSL